MWQQISHFTQTPFASLLGLGLGVLGIGLAVYFYVKGLRRKELLFFQSGRTIFSKSRAALDGLEIFYRGAPQEMVTIARLTLWNSGTDTIDFVDVSSKQPIEVCVDSSISILDFSVVDPERSPFKIGDKFIQNGLQIISIEFEYLDPKDGGALEIIHNGPEAAEIAVRGRIKGGKGPTGIDPLVARRPRAFGPLLPLANSKAFGWLATVTYIALAAFLVNRGIDGEVRVGYLIGGVMSILGALGMYFGYTKEQVPTKFLRNF